MRLTFRDDRVLKYVDDNILSLGTGLRKEIGRKHPNLEKIWNDFTLLKTEVAELKQKKTFVAFYRRDIQQLDNLLSEFNQEILNRQTELMGESKVKTSLLHKKVKNATQLKPLLRYLSAYEEQVESYKTSFSHIEYLKDKRPFESDVLWTRRRHTMLKYRVIFSIKDALDTQLLDKAQVLFTEFNKQFDEFKKIEPQSLMKTEKERMLKELEAVQTDLNERVCQLKRNRSFRTTAQSCMTVGFLALVAVGTTLIL